MLKNFSNPLYDDRTNVPIQNPWLMFKSNGIHARSSSRFCVYTTIQQHVTSNFSHRPVTGSGQLEFEEFCTLAARFLVEEDTEAMQQELREAFRLYDKEGNGYITTEVFRDILHELDDKLTPQELDMMIEEIDADGSGTLDFDGTAIAP